MRRITFFAVAAFLVAGWLLVDWGPYLHDPDLIRSTIAAHRYWLPLIFILVQSLAEVLLLPGAPFTVAGGLLFGTLWGSVYSIFCSALSAMVIFWVVRYVGEDKVIGWLHERSQVIRRYSSALKENGFRHVFILRLMPFTPGNLLSVGYGLSTVKAKDYFWGTLWGNLPSTILLSYLGNFILAKDSFTYILIGSVAVVGISALLYWYGGGVKIIEKS